LLPVAKSGQKGGLRSSAARLKETVDLTKAIRLNVVHAEEVPVERFQPSTLIGRGAVARIGAAIADAKVDLVVVDAAVSPAQQRNLERAWQAKVIDRTGLILEIFGERASTNEGRLQVELAHLSYQRSRLVRSWTHLERQRGGFGFLGGPGERQIEVDRRLIDARILHIRRELESVIRTRALHRVPRRNVPYPLVALVGYTNAGKSTLFNRLVNAGVAAKDQLFTTLDPTLRGLVLPSGRRVILSDTVGFVDDLPTHLVAAFRATLEEVVEADILIHVRDITDTETEAQAADVNRVLSEIGIASDSRRGMIEVWNKIDRLPSERRIETMNRSGRDGRSIALSALTGEGVDALLTRLNEMLATAAEIIDLTVDLSDGEGLAWLYRHGEVLSRKDDTSGSAHLRVGLDAANLARFERRRARGKS
jgi:GTP-binding protein HflX